MQQLTYDHNKMKSYLLRGSRTPCGVFAILHNVCRIGSRHTGGTPNKLLDRYGLKLLIERHKAFSVRPGYVKKNIFCKFINFNNNLNFIIGIMHLNLVVFQVSNWRIIFYNNSKQYKQHYQHYSGKILLFIIIIVNISSVLVVSQSVFNTIIINNMGTQKM